MMMSTKARRPGRRATAVATMAIGALGLVAGLAPAALAQDSDTPTTDPPAAEGNRPKRPELTDEQKACLDAQGIEKPAKDADGNRAKPTDEQRAKFKAAAKACGLPARPDGPKHPKLTDEQKACLDAQGIEKPAKDADGKRAKPTDEQRAKFEAAAKECGIELPQRPADADSNAKNGSGSPDNSNADNSKANDNAGTDAS
jgi:hypothetical protein